MKFAIGSAALLAAAMSAPAAAQNQASGAAAPAAAAGAEPQITISRKATKAFQELQAAVNAKDAANIPAKVAAAQAAAQTNQDRYAIAALQLKAAVDANDNAAAANALNAMAAAGVATNVQIARKHNALGVKMYNAKDFPAAAAQFERATALDPSNVDALNLLAETRASQGQPAAAIATLSKVIEQAGNGGRKVDENVYKRAVSIAYDAKLPAAVGLAQQWVAAYPSADSWHNAIAIYRNLNRPDVAGTLDLLRLLRATKAMTTPGNYGLYARAAAEQNLFVEAQTVIDEGIAAKLVNPSSSEFRDIVVGLKSKPKATAADLAVATKAAVRPANLIGIGDRYAALGDYAAAVDVYKQAIAKGGDKDLANLHIGIALARSGDKAGALAALAQVGGSQAGIAKFWQIYVQRLA